MLTGWLTFKLCRTSGDGGPFGTVGSRFDDSSEGPVFR